MPWSGIKHARVIIRKSISNVNPLVKKSWYPWAKKEPDLDGPERGREGERISASPSGERTTFQLGKRGEGKVEWHRHIPRWGENGPS